MAEFTKGGGYSLGVVGESLGNKPQPPGLMFWFTTEARNWMFYFANDATRIGSFCFGGGSGDKLSVQLKGRNGLESQRKLSFFFFFYPQIVYLSELAPTLMKMETTAMPCGLLTASV